MEKRIPGLGGAGGTHGKIDKDNPYWVGVRAVHDQLDDALGYKQRNPGALDGAAGRLDGVVDDEPGSEDEVGTAARLI